MAKKSGGKPAAKPAAKSESGSADFHRKMAQTYSAKARIHGAKADLADAMKPPKKSTRGPFSY